MPNNNTMGELLPADVAAAMKSPRNVLGRYILIQQVGKGGMGAVFKAWQLDLKRYVAIKFLTHSDIDDIRRFYREAQSAAKLNHPNIAQVYEVNVESEKHFLVMEFVEGKTLERIIRKKEAPLKTIVKYIRDAALGLNHAHLNGIVHRDVKPGNIMVTEKGRVYVMDFGLAKKINASENTRITQTGMVVGTPSYMSPEQAEGDVKTVDRYADVWSLGASLYEAITGRPPFTGKSAMETVLHVVKDDPVLPTRFNPECPKELEAITLKCLEKDKKRRYPSAKHLADDLNRWLNDQPVSVGTATGWRQFVRKLRRNCKLLAIAAAGAAVVIGALVYALVQSSKSASQVEAGERRKRSDEKYEQARSAWLLVEKQLANEAVDVKSAREKILNVFELARQAHEIDKTSDKPLQVMGSTHLAIGDYEAAIKRLGEAIERNPTSPLALYDRVRAIAHKLILRTDLIEKSSKQELLKIAQEDSKALAQLKLDTPGQSLFLEAVAAYFVDDYKRAQEKLVDLLRIDSAQPDYHTLLGLTLLKMGQVRQGYERLREAMRRGPNSFLAIVHRARCSEQMVDRDVVKEPELKEIVASLQRLKALNPDSGDILLAAGEFHLKSRKDISQGMEEFNAALAKDPENLYIMFRVAELLLKLDRKQEADEWLKKAERRTTEFRHYVRFLRASYILVDTPKEAAKELTELSRDPTVPPALRSLYYLELASMKLRMEDEVLGAFDDAVESLKHNPYRIEPFVVQALVRLFDKKNQAAIDLANEAIRRDTETLALAIDTRALAHGIAGIARARMILKGERPRDELKTAKADLQAAVDGKAPREMMENITDCLKWVKQQLGE